MDFLASIHHHWPGLFSLRNDYKAFNNSTTWETADFSSLPAIQVRLKPRSFVGMMVNEIDKSIQLCHVLDEHLRYF